MTKVSIITATFNSESTILETIGSVHAQRDVDKEHIVVDGASTDRTMELVGNHASVTKSVSEPDEGIYHAMNKGISLATGDIVGILNSDDTYSDDRVLASVMGTFERSGADVVYGDLVYVHSSDPSRIVRTWKSGAYREGSFKWGWMPPHPTFFVRREAYLRHGLFNLDIGTSADYELMLRFMHIRRLKAAYLDRVLVRMRSGGASNESLAARWKANRNDRKAWKMNGVSPFWFTMYLKPIRKVGQYLIRRDES